MERLVAGSGRFLGFTPFYPATVGYGALKGDNMSSILEVLFTFLGERYERRSVVITSNLVFSKWDRIFKDPMTTAAAIDRVVHHSTILELVGPSIRKEVAEERNNIQ